VTATTPADPVVPAWLRRTGAISWRLLAISGLGAVTIWLAVVLGTVTVSVLVALIVAATFAPMVRRLRAGGWSPAKASAAVTFSAFVLVAGTAALLVIAFLPDIAILVSDVQDGIDELRDQLAAVSVPAAISAQIALAVHHVEAFIGAGLGNVVEATTFAVTVGILALFLTFFVLVDGERAWVWLLQVTTQAKRERIDASGRDALDRVGGYLRGTAILSAARASSYAVFLYMLGVPQVLSLALLALLGGFIPYVGPLVAMVAILLAALGTVGPQTTLILLVLILVANAIVANFLRPILYGRTVHLHPAIVLVAIPAGAAIAGIVGVFAAIPAVAFAVAIGGALIDALKPDTEPRSDSLVAGWVDRLAQWSWRMLAAFGVAAVVLFVVGQAPLVVVPIVLALVIASSVAPVARVLRRRGWGAGRASLAATGGIFLLILALIGLALAQVAGPAVEAILAAIDNAAELEDDAAGSLGWVGSAAQGLGGDLVEAIGAVVQAIGAIGVVLLLSALLSFYFLRDGSRGWALMVERAASWRRDALDDSGREAVRILGSYMLGTAAISAVGAVSQAAIMIFFGFPFVIPIAILSFILAFIPYIGGFISTGLAFLIAVGSGTPLEIAIMFVWTIVFNIIQGNVVTPLVYKRAVNLHPAIVLLAIPAGGAMAGIAGMFLAVPFLAVVASTWRTFLYVMGEEPSGSPRAVQPPADESVSAEPAIDGIPASAE
jgi:predicted PurR-regulated permease PerM